ncbi:sporulation-delaying protein SdpB family protein [Longispora urticae]
MAAIRQALAAFEPRTVLFGAARSLLALAQLSIFVFSSDLALFSYTTQAPDGFRCDGLRAASLWCLGSSGSTGLVVTRVLVFAVLVAVAAGYRPRLTCVPHWYVTYSISASVTQTNGGEQVALIMTVLLVPMCLGDGRAWHWSPPEQLLQPAWRGAAYAGGLTLRVQAAIVYLWAAVAKLTVAEWRDGTAISNIAHHPYHGFLESLQASIPPVFSSQPAVAALTWGTVSVELLIAVLVLGSKRMCWYALLLGIALHLPIAVLMGLPSFSLVMVALLSMLYASCGASPREGHRLPRVEPAGHTERRSTEGC